MYEKHLLSCSFKQDKIDILIIASKYFVFFFQNKVVIQET